LAAFLEVKSLKKISADADGGPRSRVRTAGHSAPHRRQFFFTQIFIILFRSPCKIWEPYDNPFWKNSDGGREKEEEKKRKSQ
jgi:hypothetical protein